ncbi:MAG: hypothetical protein AMXMBFR84_36240 [Candidatus Hydrogenedentota bacterium]
MKLQLDNPSFDAPWIIAGLLLIPYLCWGVYLLRFRLRHHLDFNRATETFTVAALLFFFLLQFSMLHQWLARSPALYLLASLGLIVSGVALYGPIVGSFVSHSLVELVMPGAHADVHEPRYGAGEAFERQSDFENAAREYMAVSRMFPKDATSPLRAADNLVKVERFEEAAEYFEIALGNSNSADQCLRITNRLADLYQRHLNQPADAVGVLEQYLADFPDTEFAESIRARLKRLREPGELPVSESGSTSSYSYIDSAPDTED